MNNPKILVVEDDASVRNLITTTLRSNDYRYITAPNGASAILSASSQQPDIVLLDLGLPDLDGVEIIRRIRSWSQMPIIVISARSEDSDKVSALDAGADDYLTKPFSVTEMLARLRVAQRRIASLGGKTEEAVFCNGKLRIDYAAGCAYLSEKPLKLTPTEYKLLCLLAKDAGKVLTDPYLPDRQDLGQQLGKRHGIAAGPHGDIAQKAGKRSGYPIHPNPHRHRLPDAEGGIMEMK